LRSESGETLSGLQSNNLNCPDHKHDVYSIYCHSCNLLICEKCSLLESLPPGETKKISSVASESNDAGPKYGHRGHYMRGLDILIKSVLTEKQKIKKDIKEQFSKIDAALEFFEGVEELNLK
jgi:hypothetical protein